MITLEQMQAAGLLIVCPWRPVLLTNRRLGIESDRQAKQLSEVDQNLQRVARSPRPSTQLFQHSLKMFQQVSAVRVARTRCA